MKIIINLLFFLFTVNLIISQDNVNKNQFWGDSGYILETERVKEGFEGQIKDKKDGDNINEYERWFFRQTVFLGFNYRYSNIIEIGSEIGLTFRNENDLIYSNPYNLIKQLYIKASPAYWLSFNFGKQRLKWGTLSTFHPIDKLETVVDPLGARKVEDGVLGIKATFLPTDWFSVQILALPDFQVRFSKFALRMDFLVADIDIGVGAIKYDVSLMKDIDENTGSFKIDSFDRGAFFFDIVRYFGNVGLMGDFEFRFSRENEYAFYNEDTKKYYFTYGDAFKNYPVFRAGAGLKYKMDIKPYMNISFEYFYNSEGFNLNEARDFNEQYKYHKDQLTDKKIDKSMILPQNFGTFGSFNRHYLSLSFSDIAPVDFFSFQLGTICGVETLSFDISHGFTFNIRKLIYITFKHDIYQQFLDKNLYPGDLNYQGVNHKITLYVTSSFAK